MSTGTRPQPSAQAARDRKLLMASGSMLLLAGSLVGGLFFLRGQAQAPRFQPGQRIRLVSPELAKKQRTQRLAKAQWVRDKWRPWARKNKEVLLKLARSQPGDESALMTAFYALPTVPTPSTMGFSVIDLAEDIQATWQPGLRWMLENPQSPGTVTPGNEHRPRDDRKLAMTILRRDFAAEHDIVLSQMSSPDSPTTFVWVSGRVTEQEPGPLRVEGERGTSSMKIVYHPHQELSPPYEFLR